MNTKLIGALCALGMLAMMNAPASAGLVEDALDEAPGAWPCAKSWRDDRSDGSRVYWIIVGTSEEPYCDGPFSEAYRLGFPCNAPDDAWCQAVSYVGQTLVSEVNCVDVMVSGWLCDHPAPCLTVTEWSFGPDHGHRVTLTYSQDVYCDHAGGPLVVDVMFECIAKDPPICEAHDLVWDEAVLLTEFLDAVV